MSSFYANWMAVMAGRDTQMVQLAGLSFLAAVLWINRDLMIAWFPARWQPALERGLLGVGLGVYVVAVLAAVGGG